MEYEMGRPYVPAAGGAAGAGGAADGGGGAAAVVLGRAAGVGRAAAGSPIFMAVDNGTVLGRDVLPF